MGSRTHKTLQLIASFEYPQKEKLIFFLFFYSLFDHGDALTINSRINLDLQHLHNLLIIQQIVNSWYKLKLVDQGQIIYLMANVFLFIENIKIFWGSESEARCSWATKMATLVDWMLTFSKFSSSFSKVLPLLYVTTFYSKWDVFLFTFPCANIHIRVAFYIVLNTIISYSASEKILYSECSWGRANKYSIDCCGSLCDPWPTMLMLLSPPPPTHPLL